MMDEMLAALAAGLPELGLDLPEQTQRSLCDFGCAVVKQVSALANWRLT